MGLPGFSGFVAELQVLIGAWHAFPGFALLAGLGIVIGVAYTLRALQQSFFSETERTTAGKQAHPLEPISIPERIGGTVLIASTLIVGLCPRLLLDLIVPSFRSPLFEALRRGGGF